MKVLEKFDKIVHYEVNSNGENWMVVDDGAHKYMYITKNRMEVPGFNLTPTYINRKSMWELMVHFGCAQEDINSLFDRGN